MVTTERGDAPSDGAVLETARPRRADPLLLRAVRSMTRLTRPLAGRRFFPLWALLRHRGRRSGREYAVPVGVRMTVDGYFIALPFGERTQWVHNVVAAHASEFTSGPGSRADDAGDPAPGTSGFVWRHGSCQDGPRCPLRTCPGRP